MKLTALNLNVIWLCFLTAVVYNGSMDIRYIITFGTFLMAIAAVPGVAEDYCTVYHNDRAEEDEAATNSKERGAQKTLWSLESHSLVKG